MKYYTFQYRKTQSIRLEVEHDFKDMPSLEGLTGLAYYQSQQAIFDLASTRALSSWTAKLRSDKLGLLGHYQSGPRWTSEGELALYAISDGNTRTDFWYELRRILSQTLQVGARYESVSAKRSLPPDNPNGLMPYWSPANYQTLSLTAQLENSFNRWSYQLHGGVGRVLSTNDALRNFSAQVQWRVTRSASLAAAFLDLATTRVDGQYAYRGMSVSFTLER